MNDGRTIIVMRKKKGNALINERWLHNKIGAKMICLDPWMMDAQKKCAIEKRALAQWKFIQSRMRNRRRRTCAILIYTVQNAQQLQSPKCATEKCVLAQL